MKQLDISVRDTWLAGDYTGPARPMMRCTVQHLNVLMHPYSFQDKTTVTLDGVFTSDIFSQLATPLELPNLKSVDWTRDVDQDVAQCTLVFYNTQPLALGQTPSTQGDFDQPGYYTSDRGEHDFSAGWDLHTVNGWQDRLQPDNIIRTYEGYGFDPGVGPDLDSHMSPSGVWIITDVDEVSQPGLITVTAQDLFSTLVTQINFPPVVPLSRYPLFWEHYRIVKNPDKIVQTTGWVRPAYAADSNLPYIAHPEITDGGLSYVGGDGSVYGHHGRDAFDGSASTYFLSVGNHSDWSSAYEWVQGSIKAGPVDGVRINPYAGPYMAYISIYVKGKGWQGKGTIPYRHRVVDAHTRIPYVKSVRVGRNAVTAVKLPKTYANVTAVRVTFTHLWNSGLGLNYPYRAAIRTVEVHTGVTKAVDGGTHWEGSYDDYTDLVKWWLAWAGWFWPKDAAAGAKLTQTDGSHLNVEPLALDPVIQNEGAIWGDFENTGTYGPATLTVDLFDKKPILDCLHYVRDIIGWNLWVDETGGAIWRAPNIYAIGNYLTPVSGGANAGRTGTVLTISEKETLVAWGLKKSSKNIRERVFVGNTSGKFFGASAGYNPNPTGLRRVGGYTDQNFASSKECQVMSDFITVRQAFTYRTGQMTIAANPEIQIDDQLRVKERNTEEYFYHYVKSIKSSWDIESGKWPYVITTHWLGESPFDAWAFDPGQLSQDTQAYLTALGKY